MIGVAEEWEGREFGNCQTEKLGDGRKIEGIW